jgi:hypothetical protein
MKRFRFFAALLGFAASAQTIWDKQLKPRSLSPEQPVKPGRKKYFITGLIHTKEFNDCNIPPIVCYGETRSDALLRCCEGGGLTVWPVWE